MRKFTVAAAALLLGLTPALGEGRRLVVDHEATAKECGACHMAFPAQMLPARSWTALMGDLANHFGENAQLDAKVATDISTYLVANAADAPASRKSPWLRGIKPDQTPLRITETPVWIRMHSEEVSPAAFTNPKVGSKANCKACHTAADKGYYGDD